MATSYVRQSSMADGDTITAALFNDEFNRLLTAFSYASSSTTGHRHDGSAGEGGNIHTIGDQDFLNKILTTGNTWEFYVEVSSSAAKQMVLQDGALVPNADSDLDLGTSSIYFKDAYIDSITTTGNVAVGGNLAVTGTTTFNGGTITLGDAAADNVVFGADVDSHIIPDDDDTFDLGSASQQWRNVYVDGTVFVDVLDLAGTTITATAAELNILDGVTSTAEELNILDGVTSTATELNILDGVTSTAAELNILDGVTSTTAELNILDGVTSTFAELNILDGVTSTAAELNILDGVTATTTELNLLDGVTSTTAELNILDGVTSTAEELNILDGVTSTATELNALDGITAVVGELNALDLGSTAIGTAIASKAIILDANKDYTGVRNLTISGELDAGSLDVSGNVDIDGTLETDVLSINSTVVTATAAELNILDGVTSTATELNLLDGVTSTTAELNILDGVTSTAAELNILDGKAFLDEDNLVSNSATGIASQQSIKTYVDGITTTNITATGALNAGSITSGFGNIDVGASTFTTTGLISGGSLDIDNVVINGTTIGHTDDTDLITLADGVVTIAGEISVTTLDIGGTNVTSTAAELNILDGVTSTATELNLLDGVTSTTAELNVLDGITAVVGELNALDIGSTAVGTAVASKAVILDSDKDYTGIRNLTISGDLTVSGDDLIMGTNTAGMLLVADGTNFNPTAVSSLTEISTVANDDVFIAIDTSGGGLKKVSRSAIVAGLAASGAISNVVEDTTPQLGGNLDLNGADIITLSNAPLDLAPHGTGTVVVRGNSNSGAIVFNCELNSHGQKVYGQPHSASVTNTLMLPAGANSTLVSRVSVDTLTNKTLTSPKINEDVAVTSTATELNLLDGVTSTTAELNILDGVTSTAAELNILDGVTSTAAELNILDGVTSTAAELNILDGVTSTAAELNALDGITAVVGELNALDIGSTAVGTAVASKAVILDSNKDYTGVRNLTISGELDAATLDISGDVDIDGTLETDALSLNGTAVTSTAAELNALDGITAVVGELNALDLGSTAVGTAVASKAVILDSNKDYTGMRNFTITGNLSVGGTTTVVNTVTMNAENAVVFEGATADAHETTLTIIDPTADRTINLPNQSGTVPVLAAASNTAVTATPEELNILDGVTSTAAELNILDGVTSTAAELNALDGITAVVGELNALDLGSTAVGTAVASKAVILDSSKDYTGVRNFTLSGELDAGSLDISGDADIDGTLETDALSINGTAVTSTAAELNILDGVTSTAAELNALDGITAVVGELNALDIGSTAIGTAVASKAVILDSNKDYTGVRNFTVSGELDAATGDFSGDVDIDGTLETDALSINGTAVTSTAAELNILDGVTSTAAELNILDGVTSTAAELNILDGVTSTAAELNALDGITAVVGELNALDIGSTAVGTAVASKAVILDSNKDYTGLRNFTISGELDAATGDFSGDVDIDGTLETDALSINGTAVTSTAAELNILDGVTATATELNLIDGVTSTTAELNILDGVTSTAAELNILDGVTSTAAELNILDGVTSTAAELNLLDGLTDVGFKNIPQNSKSAAYTLVLGDSGKHIFHPVGDNNARTFTIPANGSVAYPIGTAITFVNMAVADVTIAITSDTMYLAESGATGSRTLAQYGSATAIKLIATTWLISGSGLS
jgi:cytoskeletal protein CcmA (bactofilin family)